MVLRPEITAALMRTFMMIFMLTWEKKVISIKEMEMMISVTHCLGNGPPKLTGLMGLWPRYNSCCLRVSPNACPVSWRIWQLQGHIQKEEGLGVSSRSWGADVGREGLRAESGHRWCLLLFQFHPHWLAWTSACIFPSLSFPIYKMEVTTAPRYEHFYFLQPVAIYLSLALPLLLIWASSPIPYDLVSTPDWVLCVIRDVFPATVIFSRMGSRCPSKPLRSQTWVHSSEPMRFTGSSGKWKEIFSPAHSHHENLSEQGTKKWEAESRD